MSSLVQKGVGSAIVNDGGIALRIRCIANPESTPNTADAVLVSATSLTLKQNGSADTSVGASGVLAFATYTTLGALVDAINASGTWQAEIVGGLRADAINGSQLLARSTSVVRNFAEIDLYWDSSVHLGLDVLLEPGIPFEGAPSSFVKGMNSDRRFQHRVGFQRVICKDDNDGTALSVTVYELKPQNASTVKTIASFTPTDNTELDSGVDAPVLHADYGNNILIRFAGATSFTDTSCYLKAFGILQ